MKIEAELYNTTRKFDNVEGYAPTEHYFTIMHTIDNRTVETIIPRIELRTVDVFHSVNLVEEMAAEAAAKKAREQLTIPGM